VFGLKRREFITLLGGTAIAWPLPARAQQALRRVGALLPTGADDPQSKARIAAFLNELHRLGWIEGRNIRIDIRWTSGNEAETRKHTSELAAVVPDR
jgi:putative tryptophan/tyrosine transport system substrate-binding protein